LQRQVKIRLTANIADDGKNEITAYERAKQVAEETGLPLMTHHALSSVVSRHPAQQSQR